MKVPTTLSEALSEIQELRGQVSDLLRMLEAEAGTGRVGVADSPESQRSVHESSEEPDPGCTRVVDAQALRELHQVIGTIPDVIFKLDLQGNLVGWNKRLEVVTGFSPEELHGRPAVFFVPEQEYPKTSAAIRQALEEGYAELEGHLLTKHRRPIPYHWTGAALRDEEGRVVGIAGVGRDVTQKRQIESELRKQRRLLLWAQTLAHVGSWEWEIASGNMEWSEEQWRIFGRESGTMPATYAMFLAAVQPDDRDRVVTEISEMLRRGGTLDMECRIARPTGEIRTIHCRGEIIRNEEGSPTHVSGSTVDITDRRQAESALRRSEAHFRTLIENSSDIITILDLDGRIRFESPSFERLLGYEQHELNGRVAFEFVHPGDLPTVLEKFQVVIERPGETQIAEYRFRHKDGSWLALEGIGRCILDTEGQRCVIVNSRDVTERKRAEQALARSHNLLKSFVEHTPAAVAMLDKDLRYIAVSRRWLQDYRLAGQDLIGRHHYEVFPEIQSMAEWQAIHQRCLKGAVERREEERFVRADGSEDWLRWEVRPWQETTGDIGGIIMFTEVITEHKRAEALLRSSEEKLRQALTASNTGLWDWNTETNEVRLSREWKRQLGYEEAELPDTFESWKSRLHPDDHDRAVAYVVRYREHPVGAFRQDFRLRHKDGTYRWIESHASFVTETDGRRVRLLGSHTDITERKLAEKALRISEERYARATAVGKVGVWELDVQGGSYHADANLKALFGYGLDDLSTDPLVWFELVHPDDRSTAWQAWERVVSGVADEYHYELRVIRKDGTVIWTDVRGHAERDDRGILRRLIGATVDITERKLVQETLARKEQDLRAALEERERLSQDLHDGILQSLYAVGLGLESCKLLLKRGRSKQAVDAMEQAIGRMNRVMAEIRNFIAGLDSQILQGIDFTTAMRSMAESLSTADTPCRLTVDELAVRHISTQQAFHLLNVVREALSNGLRHARATRISVSLKRLNRSVRLSVTDNGIGFEPATAHGLGHGLANMAARVRKIGGRLVLRSKLQQGTKIVIDLPKEGMT